MRKLTPEETAAMWLYGTEYARGGLGAIEFYQRLDASRKRVIDDFVADMLRAFGRQMSPKAPR